MATLRDRLHIVENQECAPTAKRARFVALGLQVCIELCYSHDPIDYAPAHNPNTRLTSLPLVAISITDCDVPRPQDCSGDTSGGSDPVELGMLDPVSLLRPSEPT